MENLTNGLEMILQEPYHIYAVQRYISLYIVD